MPAFLACFQLNVPGPRPQLQPDSDTLRQCAGPIMVTSIPHPFPYQGSKRSIAHHILPYLPYDTERLIEPFCGSAAVSIAAAFHGVAAKFAINDIDAPLMALWTEILRRPGHLSNQYEQLWSDQHPDSKGHFYRIRAEFNETHQPHHLLYLLARIVKGAVRYSSEGSFNQSPDNRRFGMQPAKMRRQIIGVSTLLADRTTLSALDFRDIVTRATPLDVVYMDPPYQGTSFSRDHRYHSGITYNELADVLALMNLNQTSYIVSYDGRTGEKSHGKTLPDDLRLHRLEVHAGKSSQATLLGEDCETVESLYLSPALVNRLSSIAGQFSWLGPVRLVGQGHG